MHEVISLVTQHDIITCCNCRVRFVLFWVTPKEPYQNSEAIPQGIVSHCPFCGKPGTVAYCPDNSVSGEAQAKLARELRKDIEKALA